MSSSRDHVARPSATINPPIGASFARSPAFAGAGDSASAYISGMTDDKATISPEEMQRRRAHVRAAIADGRIEGFPPPSRPEQDILDAYIRGEIDAGDLVTAIQKTLRRVYKCTWIGCPATTERPALDGWTHLADQPAGDWGHGIKDGLYCPAHTAALEAVHPRGRP